MTRMDWPVPYSKVWVGRGGGDFDDIETIKACELEGLSATQFNAISVSRITVRRGGAVDGVQNRFPWTVGGLPGCHWCSLPETE